MYLNYEYVSQKFYSNIKDIWTLKEVIEETTSLGEKTFLIDAETGDNFSYEQSNRLSNKIAHSLLGIGLSKGDRVGIYMKNNPFYVFSLFAIGKAGLVEVPINPNFREPEILHIINTAHVSTIIVEANMEFINILSKISSESSVLKNVIIVGDIKKTPKMEANIYLLTELMENSDESNPDIKVNESDPTCIFFTSGTTGLPKGAPLSNKTYILAAKSICAIPLVNKKSRNYTCLPLFHANAQLYSVTGMRCLGVSLVLSDHFSPRNFFNKISKYKATYFNSIGGMMQILDVTFGEEDVPEHTAKFVAVGGTPKELWERFEKKFKVDIFEAYSMSEVPVLFGNFHPEKSKRKVGSFGKPIFADLGRETKIVDDHNQEVKAGVGDLIQKGQDFMMKEYLNAPKATSEVFDADGWIHSGDIVRKDEEGYHYFVDRKKFIIRVAGENVSAFEVEDVVNSHPAIEQSAAIPVPDPIRGEEIKIFIKLKEGINDVNMEEIIEHCAQRLAYFKVPRYIEIVSKFPKTSTERIQKMTLKNEERARECHGWDRNKEIPDWRNKYYNIK